MFYFWSYIRILDKLLLLRLFCELFEDSFITGIFPKLSYGKKDIPYTLFLISYLIDIIICSKSELLENLEEMLPKS